MSRPWDTGARRAAALLAAVTLGSACAGDRGSSITVAYRGDVAAYREMVRVRFDANHAGRVVIPSFPSAAQSEAIGTSGEMQVVVTVKNAAGELLARDSLPPLQLVPRTSWGVNVVVSTRHPAQTPCSGSWRASPIAPPAAESLYVSVTATDRAAPPPRCDD